MKMKMNKMACLGIATAMVMLCGTVQGVTVPNGDFEDWQAHTGAWSSVGGDGVVANQIGANDEFWTGGGSGPSSFGSGWQENNKTRTDGKFGLQHPSDAQHSKEAGDNSLSSPGNGFFIGFANLTEGDGAGESMSQVQSGVLGQLQQGIYTLNVAVGARLNATWQPIDYTISLVAGGLVAGDPNDNQFGTSGGTVLGSTTQSNVQFPGSDNTEWFDLELVVDTTGSANLGDDFAIRIESINAGDTSSFTQANFDNVRLEFIPEPASLVLVSICAIGLLTSRRGRM